MKVVSFWNPKGGQGKTPLALNVAAAAVEIGLSVILIDRDLQGSAIIYKESGNLPYDVLSEIPEEAPDVDLVILDHMATDYEIPPAKIVVIPFIPERDHYNKFMFNKNKVIAAGGNKNIISVVTNGDLRNKNDRDLVYEVKKRGVYEVKRSGVFKEAAAHYTTIFDKMFDKYYSIDLTRSQISSILTAILKES